MITNCSEYSILQSYKPDSRIKIIDMRHKNIGCVIAYRKGHTNYGTSLVGYALIRKLQQMGCEVEVINYVKQPDVKQKVAWVVNAMRCGMGHVIANRMKGRKDLKNNADYAANIQVRTEAVEAYKERKFIPLFRDYVGYKALHEGSKNYDAVVVGSDQVWTPLSLPTRFFNLLFVDDAVRKVAYASSFGVSSIPKFQRKATGAFLDRFHTIGVREQSGKQIVDTLSHQTATVVADPTLLLDATEWSEEIKNSDVKPTEPYIFCYFLGTNREARKAANELKARTGLKIVTLRHMDEYVAEDELFGDDAPYDVDPNDFLAYIKQADYVLTDSFHCSAFSIQFHKRFMTFYRFAQGSATGRNSRIDSLFSVLGVSREHIYTGDVTKVQAPLDWDGIDANLKRLREESVEFLAKSLG